MELELESPKLQFCVAQIEWLGAKWTLTFFELFPKQLFMEYLLVPKMTVENCEQNHLTSSSK